MTRPAPLRAALSLCALAAIGLGGCRGDPVSVRDPGAVLGDVRISVKTFGVNHDPDGFTLDVRGRQTITLPTNGEIRLPLTAGAARLTLGGVADNCTLSGSPVRTVGVNAGAETYAAYFVTCGGGTPNRVAFASTRSGLADIYMMDESGANLTRLTNNDWLDSDPVWSPTGDRLAFASTSPDSMTTVIHVIAADGRHIATLGDSGSYTGYPSWSPDSDRLAFASNRSGNHEIYVANADGSDLRRLTNTPEDELRPDWSPDGARLVFDATVPDSAVAVDLFIMRADGSDRRRVTTHGRYNFHAAWSPNGEKVAFVSQRDANEEVYVVNVASGVLARVTTDGASDGSPEWTADGEWIVFESARTGVRQLYRARFTGQNLTQLTNSLAHDFDPALTR